ncbi:hypothetical protein QEN19_003533 [Hanseniaspora menglaensis]
MHIHRVVSLLIAIPLFFATFTNSLFIDDEQQIHLTNQTLPYHFKTSNASIQDLNEINAAVRPGLLKIVNSDFFKYFKLNLFSECPFWDDNNGFCTNRACAVDLIEDDKDLPEYWKPEALGKINDLNDLDNQPIDAQDELLNQLCNKKFITGNHYSPLNCRDIDYCDVDYITNHPDAVLVDLVNNPERFTGYGGEQSGLIWKSIYSENCFLIDDKDTESLAKEVFYKLISGMHASIGVHLSNDYLDTKTGNWGPNLDLFMFRVGNWTDRIENIYFNYAIVAKAIQKISPFLQKLEFCSQYDNQTLNLLNGLSTHIDENIFHEELIFDGELSSALKDQFRVKFKNVTKIMDCVHCDRCRLWGKVQSTGYATSLKILLEMDNDPMFVINSLTKYELIALLNTFDRISKSVQLINNFEVMFNEKYNTDYIAPKNNIQKMLDKVVDKFNLFSQSFNSQKEFDDLEEDENIFVDVILPTEEKNTGNGIQAEFRESWNQEMEELINALKFIGQSYIDFPKNLYKLLILKLNSWYNNFIY